MSEPDRGLLLYPCIRSKSSDFLVFGHLRFRVRHASVRGNDFRILIGEDPVVVQLGIDFRVQRLLENEEALIGRELQCVCHRAIRNRETLFGVEFESILGTIEFHFQMNELIHEQKQYDVRPVGLYGKQLGISVAFQVVLEERLTEILHRVDSHLSVIGDRQIVLIVVEKGRVRDVHRFLGLEDSRRTGCRTNNQRILQIVFARSNALCTDLKEITVVNKSMRSPRTLTFCISACWRSTKDVPHPHIQGETRSVATLRAPWETSLAVREIRMTLQHTRGTYVIVLDPRVHAVGLQTGW